MGSVGEMCLSDVGYLEHQEAPSTGTIRRGLLGALGYLGWAFDSLYVLMSGREWIVRRLLTFHTGSQNAPVTTLRGDTSFFLMSDTALVPSCQIRPLPRARFTSLGSSASIGLSRLNPPPGQGLPLLV